MTERKINLDEILLNELEKSKYGFPEMDSDVYDNIKTAMKEACRQLLELAAENATYDWNDHEDIIIDKQSILDTINQIE